MQVIAAPSTAPIPGQYWQWRGHKIYYVQAGENHSQRPALLLVHGFGASTDHWRKNIAELSQDFQVFAIDLLGFGRSEKFKLESGSDLWRDQLYYFIKEIVSQKVVLVGNSLGGYASLCVAAQHPDVIAGLVLLNSAGPFSDAQASAEPEALQAEIQPPSLIEQLQKYFGNVVKWIFQQTPTQFLIFQYVRQKWVIRKTLEKVYYDKSAITDQLVEELYRPSCDNGAFDVFSSVFSSRQGEKLDVLLHKLQCPLLLLWGEKKTLG